MTTSRAPDCFQRSPRRISLPEGLAPHVLSLAVDTRGVHAIVRGGNIGSRLCYSVFSLNTGRQETEAPFPSDPTAFLGLNISDISLTCIGEVNYCSFFAVTFFFDYSFVLFMNYSAFMFL